MKNELPPMVHMPCERCKGHGRIVWQDEWFRMYTQQCPDCTGFGTVSPTPEQLYGAPYCSCGPEWDSPNPSCPKHGSPAR